MKFISLFNLQKKSLIILLLGLVAGVWLIGSLLTSDPQGSDEADAEAEKRAFTAGSRKFTNNERRVLAPRAKRVVRVLPPLTDDQREDLKDLLLRLNIRGFNEDTILTEELRKAVTRIDANIDQLSEEDFELLGLLGNLSQIYLSSGEDLDLDWLVPLESVEILGITSANFSNLESLEKILGLRQLYLNGGAEITDLNALAGLDGLSELRINMEGIVSLEGIEGMRALESLSINAKGVTDLTPVSLLNGLTKLDISGTGITDLTPLAGMNTLEAFSARYAKISDISAFSGAKNLRFVDLRGTEVSDLAPLSETRQMEKAYLSNSQINDLSPLRGNKAMTEIWASETSISDISAVEGMESLEILALDGNTQLADLSGVSNLPNLRTISLNQTNVTSLEALRGMSSLTSVSLQDTQVTDLGPLLGLPIRQLGLAGTAYSDMAIFDNFPEVTSYSFGRSSGSMSLFSSLKRD